MNGNQIKTGEFFDAHRIFESQKYTPNKFINSVAQALDAKNDAEVCRLLGYRASVISKVRNKRMPITPSILLRVIEATGWSIAQARAAMGDGATAKTTDAESHLERRKRLAQESEQ